MNESIFHGVLGLQLIGLFIATFGLSSLPIGDNMFEVPNDRLQVVWFTCFWSFITAGVAYLAARAQNSSVMLLAIVLMAISSTSSIVIANFFNGFTRACWQCAGAQFGEPCPDFIKHCQSGRAGFLVGCSVQIASLYLLMFIGSEQRKEFKAKAVTAKEDNEMSVIS
eukprot:c15995_g1_i1.p1 GENE.c15995_g1_i1~~c15995_g1_i1.p1  ORF type:complete len:178 (+),score=42.46 c15995_g1_i1:36-536(+)